METCLSWLGRLVEAPTGTEWRRLVDVYAPLLARWAARAGVNPADRDDLVQEVLVVVVRRVGEFDHRHPGAFRGWLRTILANHLKKHCRDRRPAEPGFDLDAVTDPNSDLSRVFDREHDEHLAARALRAVEGDFAPATWAAFTRQVLDGVKPIDVAAELGLTLNAVLLAKSRVLKRVREELRGLVE